MNQQFSLLYNRSLAARSFLVLVAFLTVPLEAQDIKHLPVPEDPLVLEPPPRSTYAIQVEYDTSESASGEGLSPIQNVATSDRPVRVQVWRDATTRRIVVDHADGTKTEGFLHDGGYVVRSTGNSNQAFVMKAEEGRAALNSLFTLKYQGTGWLETDLYRGIETSEEGDFYVFERPAKVWTPDPYSMEEGALPANYDPLDYQPLSARLHVPDKSPAEVRLGAVIYTFSPIEPWEGEIKLPDNFTDAVQNYSSQQAVLDALRRKNSR